VNFCSEGNTQQAEEGNAHQRAKLPQKFTAYYPSVLFTVFLIAAWIWRITASGSSSLNLFVILAALIATLLVVKQQLPLQNVIGLAVTIAIFWGAPWIIRKVFGFLLFPPRFSFNSVHESEFFLFWAVGFLNARGIAKLLLHRWRRSSNYGLWLIGLSSLLLVIEDPTARENLNYLAVKFLLTGIFFVAATPWFLDKKRIEHRRDYQPLFITILLLLW
jgi:hypothetical protein